MKEAERARAAETSDLEAAVAWNTRSASSDEQQSEARTKAEDEQSDRITLKLWTLNGTSEASDTLHDLQTMVRSIVVGLKTVIWCINNYRHQRDKEKGCEQLPTAMITYSLSQQSIQIALMKQYRPN